MIIIVSSQWFRGYVVCALSPVNLYDVVMMIMLMMMMKVFLGVIMIYGVFRNNKMRFAVHLHLGYERYSTV